MDSKDFVHTSFELGDRVFAKISGYRHWPAQVTEKRPGEYCVAFYGTHEIAYVKANMMFQYNEENIKKFGGSTGKKPSRTEAKFIEGMEEIASGLSFDLRPVDIGENSDDLKNGSADVDMADDGVEDMIVDNNGKDDEIIKTPVPTPNISVPSSLTPVTKPAQEDNVTGRRHLHRSVEAPSRYKEMIISPSFKGVKVAKKEKDQPGRLSNGKSERLEQPISNGKHHKKIIKSVVKAKVIVPSPVNVKTIPKVEPSPVTVKTVPKVEPSPVTVKTVTKVEPSPVTIKATPNVVPSPVTVKPIPIPSPVTVKTVPKVEPSRVTVRTIPKVEPSPVTVKATPKVEPSPVPIVKASPMVNAKASPIVNAKTVSKQESSTGQNKSFKKQKLDDDASSINPELDALSEEELKKRLEQLTLEDGRIELLLKLVESASSKRYKCEASAELLMKLGSPGYVDAAFLKSHPETVEIVRKMIRFVGNPVGWRMTNTRKEQLEVTTAKIRKAAEATFENFKSLFQTNTKPLAVQLMEEMNRLNSES